MKSLSDVINMNTVYKALETLEDRLEMPAVYLYKRLNCTYLVKSVCEIMKCDYATCGEDVFHELVKIAKILQIKQVGEVFLDDEYHKRFEDDHSFEIREVNALIIHRTGGVHYER